MCFAHLVGLCFPVKPTTNRSKCVLFPSKWLKSLFHLSRQLHRLHQLLLYKFNKFNSPKWRNKTSHKLQIWR